MTDFEGDHSRFPQPLIIGLCYDPRPMTLGNDMWDEEEVLLQTHPPSAYKYQSVYKQKEEVIPCLLDLIVMPHRD